jgi:hypothetical protein
MSQLTLACILPYIHSTLKQYDTSFFCTRTKYIEGDRCTKYLLCDGNEKHMGRCNGFSSVTNNKSFQNVRSKSKDYREMWKLWKLWSGTLDLNLKIRERNVRAFYTEPPASPHQSMQFCKNTPPPHPRAGPSHARRRRIYWPLPVQSSPRRFYRTPLPTLPPSLEQWSPRSPPPLEWSPRAPQPLESPRAVIHRAHSGGLDSPHAAIGVPPPLESLAPPPGLLQSASLSAESVRAGLVAEAGFGVGYSPSPKKIIQECINSFMFATLWRQSLHMNCLFFILQSSCCNTR